MAVKAIPVVIVSSGPAVFAGGTTPRTMVGLGPDVYDGPAMPIMVVVGRPVLPGPATPMMVVTGRPVLAGNAVPVA